MRKCDYCDKNIEVGYLQYDNNIICENCVSDLYTKEELNKEYENGNIFWTTWHDEN